MQNLLQKLFFGIKFTWPRLIVFAIASAAIVAFPNCVPALENTSFVMPAANVELWLIIGMVVACNGQTSKDAMLKTFVYFLVSQPLIYLFEVPFKEAGWGLFAYYPYWAAFTVATIPLAFLAYRMKEPGVIRTVLALIAVAALAYMGGYYIPMVVQTFPRMLLAMLFCYASAACIVVVFLPQTKLKVAAVAVAVAVTVAVNLSPASAWRSNTVSSFNLDRNRTYELVSAEDAKAEVFIENGNMLTVAKAQDGEFIAVVKDDTGKVTKLLVTVKNGLADFVEVE